MSYFSGDQTTDTTNTTNEGNTQPVDYLAQVVSQKGDQWQDPQVLAKGKLEADTHIGNLEKQLEEMRGELDKQDYAKTLLEELKAKGTPPVTEQPQKTNSTEGENTTQNLGEDELKNLMKSVLSEVSVEDQRASNLRKADEKLNELFGTNVQEVMDKRSKELGITKEDMTEMAAKSPAALLTLLGQAPSKETNDTSTSTINTDALNRNSGRRDMKYYNELRRSDRRKYFTPAVQKQILKDRLELGEKFYD